MLCESLPCALSGSSLSSDIATQVTCIVFEQCPSKFSSFGCCYLFPPFWRSCFSFLTHSLSLVSLPLRHKCVNGQVSKDKCPLSVQVQSLSWTFSSSYTSSGTRVFHNVLLPSPQPESAAVGMSITANSPFSKRKESALACKGSQFMVSCTQVTWQLA